MIIATDRRHVAKLTGRGKQPCFGDEGKAPTNLHICCHIAHVRQGADSQAAIRQRFNPCHIRQMVDVQETLGKRRTILYQPDQVGTPGKNARCGSWACAAMAFAGSSAVDSPKACMSQSLSAASAIASTMFG